MNSDLQEILSNVLSIIGFKGDKQEFIDRFVKICESHAVIELIKYLSEEKQNELKDKLDAEGGLDKNAEIFAGYINRDEYEKVLKESSKQSFGGFIKTLEPHLNEDQKSQLDAYLASLEPQKGANLG